MRIKYCVLWFLLLGSPLVLAAQPLATSSVPDAPTPQSDAAISTSSQLPYAKFYWRTIPQQYQAQPLTIPGKLKFVAHEMIEPSDLIPALVSAGSGVVIDSNPKYGTDARAFGQRFGAALVRQSSFRLFSDGLLPIAFREDPRYYRLGKTHTFGQRARYALTRVFVGRTDAGDRTFNYSAILGRAFGAGLTPAYYPGDSQTSKVVLQTFGTAVVGEISLDFLREFLPGTRF